MKRLIVLIGTEQRESQKLSRFFQAEKFRVTVEKSFKDPSLLSQRIQDSECRAVVIDLEGAHFQPHFFRDLKRLNPKLNIIGVSKKSFHPELEEAIGKHMYACLKKPIDTDEISYLLKGIFNSTESLENRDQAIPVDKN